MWWIGIVVIAGVLFLCLFCWNLRSLFKPQAINPVAGWLASAGLGAGAALMGMLTLAFSRYLVEFEGNRLTFGFTLWKVSLTIDEIVGARPEEIRWMKFGGLGWRIDWNKRFGYITGNGPGIELKSYGGSVYVFNCSEPDALLAELENAGVTLGE